MKVTMPDIVCHVLPHAGHERGCVFKV